MDERQLELTAFMPGQRLDKLLVEHLPDISRAQIQALIKSGAVLVDGQTTKPGVKLKGGEQILITLIEQDEEIPITPENIELNVVYDDEVLAVIDKPAGMVVHPAAGNESGTLVNAILARWPQIGEMDDPDKRMGLVHRLDKGTSGLIIIAKTSGALQALMRQFQERGVDKTYIALLERTPPTTTGRIEAPIARDPKQRKRMTVQRGGKPAVTEYTVIDDDFRDGQALVEVKLLTGRTHQIRVHMAFIGCPVVGDTVYGFRKQRIKMKRQFLHAAQLCFTHPVTGERLCVESELPVGLQNILSKLR